MRSPAPTAVSNGSWFIPTKCRTNEREIQTSKQRVSETLGAFPKIAEKEREGRYSDKMSDNPSTMLAEGTK